MLEFADRPVVVRERPIDAEGKPVTSGTLDLRIRSGGAGKWDDDIVFPRETCEVPRLRFTDLAVLEKFRRHAATERVGVLLLGATLGPDDRDVLRAVWPDLVERQHPYPDRKIGQVALVFPDGYRGADALVGTDGRLVTAPLEEHGPGLVFCPVKRVAEALFRAIAAAQPDARLAVENFEQTVHRRDLHHTGQPGRGTILAYSRGVLGCGANVQGIRHLAVDAMAFRAISSFNPGEITPEEFVRVRAEEQRALIFQNLGRALRGESGKTAVLFVLNADEDLRAAICEAAAILEGSERPPVVATGKDLTALVDQAGRWLAAGGGDWPAPDADKAGLKPGRRGRRPEDILGAAEVALVEGMSWRDFCRKFHPERNLGKEELDTLRARFGAGRVSPKYLSNSR
jgi:hypothetical protein